MLAALRTSLGVSTDALDPLPVSETGDTRKATYRAGSVARPGNALPGHELRVAGDLVPRGHPECPDLPHRLSLGPFHTASRRAVPRREGRAATGSSSYEARSGQKPLLLAAGLIMSSRSECSYPISAAGPINRSIVDYACSQAEQSTCLRLLLLSGSAWSRIIIAQVTTNALKGHNMPFAQPQLTFRL